MNFEFAQPAWLWLLPLAVLPWLRRSGREQVHPWLALVPNDRLSVFVDLAVRLSGALAILFIVLALAGMQRKEQPIERISRGAEIVVLLDRSRSMDQTLATRGGHAWEGGGRERKGQVAQRLLGEFVAARPEDRFAVVLFSVKPLVVSGFTQEHDIVKAAIEASGSGRGLSDTDIGTSLETALRLFSNRAYVGPRVVLLVSDGGAHLTPEIRSTLTNLIRRERVSLYWIYLRSFGSRGLMANAELGEDQAESVPEHFLHKFFQSTEMFYRAYEAESPDAMQLAIEDIRRLENRPLRYLEVQPIESLDRPLLWAALACAALVLLSQLTVSGARRRT
ncbi:MAG TPA: vWA domain-containing protein [Lautropia sp.]|nr:vWA domain-containing protein [Lautropia sp.]